VNKATPEGLRVARHYMEKRRVPRQNMVVIETSGDEDIGREEYDKEIAGPVRSFLSRNYPEGMRFVGWVHRYVETADHRAYLQDDSALYGAVCHGHPDILRILLEAAADPSIHGKHVPALHAAAGNDSMEAAVILIIHGAPV